MNVALALTTTLNQAAGQTAKNTSPTSATQAASSTGQDASAASGPGSTVINSNDFLTLLVAEMKNQDPTQPTDPNQYIQQLVGVNSLQQLISINSELGRSTSATGPSSSTTQGTSAA